MIIVLGPHVLYLLLGLFIAAVCATWAAWVTVDHYPNLDRAELRAVISGLVVIALLCAPVAVIAAYLSYPRDVKPDAPA